MYRVTRTHEIDAGHRVFGHEGKCAHLHGHRYCIELMCEPTTGLDDIGRVIDFGIMKSRLCQWLEDHWDHRMLLWEHDPLFPVLHELDPHVTALPCNPTAENLAAHLVNEVGPVQLANTGVSLVACVVHETGKCSATYEAPL